MRITKNYKRFSFMVVAIMLMSLFCVFGTESEALAASVPTERASAKVGSTLAYATGVVQAVVQLKAQPLALVTGDKVQAAAQIKAAQDQLMSSLTSKYGAKELSRIDYALNAVMIEVDAANVPAMAQEVNIKSINKLGNYSLDLSDSVPYIGGTAAQNLGYTGAGLKVAVLDSGVDYTHFALGGAGTIAAYQAAYGLSPSDPKNTTRDGLFPTAKVYEGRDFVGESWPSGPLVIDNDPIDFEGHGTHVSDIIAGKKGVAPDAKILAVKVCSAVASSCSGVALLNGVNYALNPDGNPATNDKVDVMNLSLGSDYGQVVDDLTEALNNAYLAGVVVVASAGNGSDRPYKVGSPSIGYGVISVAQTAMPTDRLFPINVVTPASIAGPIKYSVLQPWSPAPAALIGPAPVQYGNGAGGNLNGCAAFTAGSLAGKILIVNRGSCNGSIKGSNGAVAGALAIIIVNNTYGAPPTLGFGGGTPFKPTFTVVDTEGAKITSILAAGGSVTASINPADAINATGTMVSSSSRGPTIDGTLIKPDIGAPGGSISAEVGTGTGTTAFGGTSGAAPMVSGAALLVKQKYPTKTPLEIRAFLMNTAETNTMTYDLQANKYLSPITSIGAGEVRVNRAVTTDLLVTVPSDNAASLSFGNPIINNTVVVLYKTIRICNLKSTSGLYVINADFRYNDDKLNGAVYFQSGFPRNEWVNANSCRDVQLQLQIEGQKLRTWNLNAGVDGNKGISINELEYDGYVSVTGQGNKATLPWHVLPRKVSDVKVNGTYQGWDNGPTTVLQLSNNLAVNPGRVEIFNTLGTSPQKPAPTAGQPGTPGSNDSFIDLKSFGVRDKDGGATLQFAINTFTKQATPNYPAEYDIYIDSNNDGVEDYVIYNAECGGFGADGRNCVTVIKLSNGAATSAGFSDVTYNSGNLIFTVPSAAVGLAPGGKFGAYLLAYDNYNTGNLKDTILGPVFGAYSTYTIGSPRFKVANLPWTQPGVLSADGLSMTVTVNGAQVQIKTSGTSATSSSNGLLLLYRDGGSLESETVVVP